MYRKAIGILVIFSFLLMNGMVLYAATYSKIKTEKSLSIANSENQENGAEDNNNTDEELSIVELDEFLHSSPFLVHVYYGNSINLFSSDSGTHSDPYFSLPYPPPNA